MRFGCIYNQHLMNFNVETYVIICNKIINFVQSLVELNIKIKLSKFHICLLYTKLEDKRSAPGSWLPCCFYSA